MTKNKLRLTLNTLALLLVATLTIHTATAQLHVAKKGGLVPEDGNVGIGTDTPTEKLEVDGSVSIIGGDRTNANGKTNNVARVRVGMNRPVDGLAYIDLLPIPASADGKQPYVGRFLSNQNGATTFSHQGEGPFLLQTWNTKSPTMFTYRYPNPDPNDPNKWPFWNSIRIAPASDLRSTNVGIGTGTPTARLQVNGDAIKTNAGMWKGASDARLKNILGNYKKGIDAVLELNPVVFKYNGKGGITDTETEYVGLVAQEFQKVAPKAISKYIHTKEIFQQDDLTLKNGVTEEYLAIDPSEIVYMLVNAAKDQQALIETQQAELKTLKETVAKLAENRTHVSTPTATEINVLLEGTGTEKALLAQNSPNPFTTSTRIEYFIPADSRHCRMSFRDMNGKELKQVNIEHNGIGAIELSSKELAAGIYSYVLYVNGDIVASKKMILKQ